MNLFPKKQPPSLAAEDDEDVWEDLPPPPSFDAEDDWSKEIKELSPKVSTTEPSQGLNGEDDDEEAVKLKLGRSEGMVMRLDMQPISHAPPDARLLIDDLRLEEQPEDKERKRRNERKARAHGSARWVFYAGLGVMAIIAVSLVGMIFLNQLNPKVNPLGLAPLVIDQEEKYPMGEHIADLLSRKDEAIALYGRFLRTTTSSELTGMVRNVRGIETLIKNPHRPVGLPDGWQVPMEARWDVHTDQEPVFGVLSGNYPDGRKFQAFMILKGGRLLLDWEATVCYSTVPFSMLVEGKGDASEVRVWVEPTTFYPVTYPESMYRSYKIYTSLDDYPVWVFARRGTVPEMELARIFHKSMFGGDQTKASMVVLSLTRGTGDAALNQWLITDMLHTAWVLP